MDDLMCSVHSLLIFMLSPYLFICKKASTGLFLFRKFPFFKTTYYGTISPHLYQGTAQTQKSKESQRIIVLQNKSIRIMSTLFLFCLSLKSSSYIFMYNVKNNVVLWAVHLYNQYVMLNCCKLE